MYHWEIDEVAQPAYNALPADARMVLNNFMDAAVLVDPMEFLRTPDEHEGDLRTLVFGPNKEGLVAFLVYVRDDLALVVQITWAGA